MYCRVVWQEKIVPSTTSLRAWVTRIRHFFLLHPFICCIFTKLVTYTLSVHSSTPLAHLLYHFIYCIYLMVLIAMMKVVSYHLSTSDYSKDDVNSSLLQLVCIVHCGRALVLAHPLSWCVGKNWPVKYENSWQSTSRRASRAPSTSQGLQALARRPPSTLIWKP